MTSTPNLIVLLPEPPGYPYFVRFHRLAPTFYGFSRNLSTRYHFLTTQARVQPEYESTYHAWRNSSSFFIDHILVSHYIFFSTFAIHSNNNPRIDIRMTCISHLLFFSVLLWRISICSRQAFRPCSKFFVVYRPRYLLQVYTLIEYPFVICKAAEADWNGRFTGIKLHHFEPKLNDRRNGTLLYRL